MKYKIIIIVIATFITALALGIYLIAKWYNNPLRIFERKFGFELPKSATVENYKYNYFDEQTLFMKASFSESDYIFIETQLQLFFKSGFINDPMYTFHSSSDASPWWNIDENDMIASYYIPAAGKRVKTKSIIACVTSEKGQYYLYVAN